MPRWPEVKRVVRLELEQEFTVPVHKGFAYITDPDHWADYWPRFVRLAPGSLWAAPGDRAGVTLRMLGREVELEMTLRRLDPDRLVEYTSEQRGLPAAQHRRLFEPHGSGLGYRIVVEYSPRRGWRGLYDRTLVRRAILRTMRATLANLERRLG
jgi:uncharacterized protein YndB with AHSA1/START domain